MFWFLSPPLVGLFQSCLILKIPPQCNVSEWSCYFWRNAFRWKSVRCFSFFFFVEQVFWVEDASWPKLKRTGEPVRHLIVNQKIQIFFFFFFIRSLNDKKEYVKGFVRQRQYNQLNSPGTLKLIESIKNDYLSTRHTKEMVRENWVITVMGERILKEKKKRKEKRLCTEGLFWICLDSTAHWKYMDDGLPPQFVTWIIGFKQYAMRIL